jgi:hypothetical protein
MSGFVSVGFLVACFLSIFVAAILILIFFLTFLSHLTLQFGRPGDWPVSLWGQGELACACNLL